MGIVTTLKMYLLSCYGPPRVNLSTLIFVVFCGQGQMLLQYIHFVNHCVIWCMCPHFSRTVNWPSVPAATLFPQGPKFHPLKSTKPSGGLVPGPRLVITLYLKFIFLLILNVLTRFSSQQCSASCGKGTRMRYVSCRDNQGGVAEESACAHLPKPPAREVCTVVACGQWKVLEWTVVRKLPVFISLDLCAYISIRSTKLGHTFTFVYEVT